MIPASAGWRDATATPDDERSCERVCVCVHVCACVHCMHTYPRVRASTWLLVRHNVLLFGERRVYRDGKWQKFARPSDNRRVDGNSTGTERVRNEFFRAIAPTMRKDLNRAR